MNVVLHNTLIVMVGLPWSGKSTWAREQGNWPIVCPDEIRFALHGQRFIAEAEPWVWTIAKADSPTRRERGVAKGHPKFRYLRRPERFCDYTDEVRRVLRDNLVPMTAPEILAAMDIEPLDYAQPLANLHLVLKRLISQGEVERIDE